MNATHEPRPSNAATIAAGAILIALLPGICVEASPYSAAVLQDNPIGYWRLGDQGATTIDASPNHLNGTYFGGVTLGQPGAILGDPDASAKFDGTSGYAQIAPTSLINQLSKNFTIEAWVNMPQGGGGRVASTRDHASLGGFGFMVQPNLLQFTTFSIKDYIVNVPISTNDWHLVDVAFNSSDAATFYLDGQQVGTINGSSPAFTNTQPLDIGRNPIIDNSGSWEYFTGGIDEVAIYNSALQPADVAGHYAVATPEPSSVMLALLGAGALVLWRIKKKRGSNFRPASLSFGGEIVLPS